MIDTRSLTSVGDCAREGTYLLRVQVACDLQVAFGRFNGAAPVAVDAGTYLYVGSAMGAGAAPLARRTVRHMTRSGNRPPHKLRASILPELPCTAPGTVDLLPGNDKHLHWHIDYLVDRLESEITALCLIYGGRRLEADIAALLATDPSTSPICAGLGASDSRGATHLLRLDGDGSWWQTFCRRLERLVA